MAIHVFGPFRLDSEAETLFRGSEALPLGRRAAALLRALVERSGNLVSKDALIEAAWPGLVIEDSNLTVQIAALRRVLADEPDGDTWIETLPRRGYRFIGPPATTPVAENTAISQVESVNRPRSSDRPSIAVLPFANMSGDPEQDYFADGMVEDIITNLSRIKSLFVIARNSSFTYKGRAVDVKQVGRELGVRYVLEGSVRKAGMRVRITGQLVEASTGTHLWADRFDGAFKDVFELQDQVTSSVVGAIAPKVEQAEIERSKRKPTNNLDAYDYYLRGVDNLYSQTRSSTSEALRLFHKAIELDAEFASGYAMAAFCYSQRKAFGWVTERSQDIAEAAPLARRAVELTRDDALAISRAGMVLAYVVEDFDSGALFIERARTLNPNLSAVWHASGWLNVWLGEPDTAIEHLERFVRISPLDPLLHSVRSAIAFAHVFAGRFTEAVSYAEKALADNPNTHQALRATALSCAWTGRTEQARQAISRLLKIDPTLRVSNLLNLTPLRRPQDIARYQEGMSKAGLPD